MQQKQKKMLHLILKSVLVSSSTHIFSNLSALKGAFFKDPTWLSIQADFINKLTICWPQNLFPIYEYNFQTAEF